MRDLQLSTAHSMTSWSGNERKAGLGCQRCQRAERAPHVEIEAASCIPASTPPATTMLLTSTRFVRTARAAIPCAKRYVHGGASGPEFGPAVKDPSHPTGLWYHPIRSQAASPPSWAVSILPNTPKSLQSVAAMGILSPRLQASRTQTVPLDRLTPMSVAASDPDAFRPNANFFSWLHATLRDDVVPNDALLDFEASQRESGWAHLAGVWACSSLSRLPAVADLLLTTPDARHGLMPGRIPTPDNILATVAFVDSKLVPSSYEVNSTYRPLNAEEGWMQLREEWLPVLLPRLRELV